MPVSIISPPQDSTVNVGESHTFEVFASGTGTLSYQWFVNGEEAEGATSSSFSLQATLTNSYSLIYVLVQDDFDSQAVSTEPALAISRAASPNMTRHALVFNYDDNNFTWKDPAIEIQDPSDSSWDLYDITFQTYGFTPGFQERWTDYSGVSWNDANSGGSSAVRWVDTFSIGDTKEIIEVANGTLYKANQEINRTGSLKRYFVTRTQIDMDDLNSNWTTNKIKYINQFVFHTQSDQRIVADRDSNFDFYVGWSLNLMDDPDWRPAVTVDLENRANNGDYKIDYRTSGRYLSMSFDVTDCAQLAMTGGDILADERGGR